MDELTYRRDVIAYQVFLQRRGSGWMGDYATEQQAIEAARELRGLLKNADDLERTIEIRRVVEERCELKD